MIADQALNLTNHFVENTERFHYLFVQQGQIDYTASWLAELLFNEIRPSGVRLQKDASL